MLHAGTQIQGLYCHQMQLFMVHEMQVMRGIIGEDHVAACSSAQQCTVS
jgi:hypothetical protein